MTKKNKNKTDFESSIERLEMIIETMELGGIELEKSLSLFEEAMEIIKICETQLKAADQKIEHLLKKSKDNEIH